MKIGIFGAGAVGGFLAVHLANAGHEVTCIARGAHLAAMRENGLTLRSGGQEMVAHCAFTESAARAGHQDYVFVALKAHQAYEAAEALRPLLGPETPVVTVMNGIPWWYFYKLPGPLENRNLDSVDPSGRQWQAIGPERAIGCVVYSAAEIAAPGIVAHTFGETFVLGEPDGTLSDRTSNLGTVLEAARLKAPVSDAIRDEIWLKLWGNLCFNPISALTGATLDVIAKDPATRTVARAMMVEAQAIGEALGVTFRVDIERRIDRAAAVGAHKTSMLQDLERGRPLEIDALLTAIQEMGRLMSIETPFIDVVLGLVQQRARTLGLYPTMPD